MKILGLATLLESLFQPKPTPPMRWEVTAKHHLPKSKPATPERKKHRQMVQASKRQNRRGR